MSEQTSEPELIVEVKGAAGVLTLNRPKQLNALTQNMVRGIASALDAWEHDARITRIIIKGAGEKAFSAGGDIRLIHEWGGAGQYDDMRAFWHEEYTLNQRIKRYPKPYIALIDGIVMGGGAGVSINGSHRVAGPKAMFAMPEVGIGFFPDVGATYFLARLKQGYGHYYGLTGARMGQVDGTALGIFSHAVASTAEVEAALIAGDDVEGVLLKHKADQPPAPIFAHDAMLRACFPLNNPPEIMEKLQEFSNNGDAFAASTLKTLQSKSPTSLIIAHEQISRGAKLSFEDCMILEYRIVSRIIHAQDFYEGIRAVIIDKDNQPHWQSVPSPAEIAMHFAPLEDDLAFRMIKGA